MQNCFAEKWPSLSSLSTTFNVVDWCNCCSTPAQRQPKILHNPNGHQMSHKMWKQDRRVVILQKLEEHKLYARHCDGSNGSKTADAASWLTWNVAKPTVYPTADDTQGPKAAWKRGVNTAELSFWVHRGLTSLHLPWLTKTHQNLPFDPPPVACALLYWRNGCSAVLQKLSNSSELTGHSHNLAES